MRPSWIVGGSRGKAASSKPEPKHSNTRPSEKAFICSGEKPRCRDSARGGSRRPAGGTSVSRQVADGVEARVGLHALIAFTPLYDFLIVDPYKRASRFFWKSVDSVMIDGVVNGVGAIVVWHSGVWRRLQTGNVQSYALGMLVGAVAVVGGFWLFLGKG